MYEYSIYICIYMYIYMYERVQYTYIYSDICEYTGTVPTTVYQRMIVSLHTVL